jgi:hypothetical protein
MLQQTLPDARRHAPKGNRHSFKHGRHTAEAIAEWREFAALVREMNGVQFPAYKRPRN